MATATSESIVKGGAWLIDETDPATVMTPEKITEEHALIRQTATEFSFLLSFPQLQNVLGTGARETGYETRADA